MKFFNDKLASIQGGHFIKNKNERHITKALASSFTAGNAKMLYNAPFTYGRIC